MNDKRLYAESAPWRRGIEFALIEKSDTGWSALTGEMKEIQEGEIAPSFLLSIDRAQNLMDDLWNCGLRPTEGTGSAGALAATQKHLDDMRRLVFDSQKDKAE